MPETRCPASGRVCYATSGAAKIAAKDIARWQKIPQPAQYRCRTCKAVHLDLPVSQQ